MAKFSVMNIILLFLNEPMSASGEGRLHGLYETAGGEWWPHTKVDGHPA